jgi:hypothetical protein
MRAVQDQLVFKALCALAEVVEQCRTGPIIPTFAVRFALAYLYAVGDGERLAFDDFWRAIRTSDEGSYSDVMANVMRVTHAQTAMTGIARGCGVELCVEYTARLAAARRGPGTPARKL